MLDIDVLNDKERRTPDERSSGIPVVVRPATPRSTWSKLLSSISPHEVLMIVSAVLFAFFAVAASALVTEWLDVVLRMMFVCIAILGMNYWASNSKSKWCVPLKLAYIIPLILTFFKTTAYISFPIHGHDFDPLLIAADRMLCGGANPTQWLYQHFPHAPALTEYLTICYALFYIIPLSLAIELYSEGRGFHLKGHPRKKELDQIFFIIVYGFLLSYIAYCLIPSIGPRFTLHDFANMSKELPGLLITEPLQTLLNRGENIVPGMSVAEVVRNVTRDAFPSGHTDITLITIILAFHYRARLRWAILILGSSLIFSTVYLRYHYVIDLIGGAVLAVVTLYTWEWMRERMRFLHARMVGIFS